MNKLSETISRINSGDYVTIPRDTYNIAPEDSFYIEGLHFSNTAKYTENPTGERFCGIYLEGKENVTIDGNGSAVLIHGVMTPFIFKNCRNITLKNFSFDHCRPTMSEFTIVSSEKGKAVIRINDEFLYETDGNMLTWVSDPDSSGKPYWKYPYRGNQMLSNQLMPSRMVIDDVVYQEAESHTGIPEIQTINEIEKGLLEITFCNRDMLFEPGTVVQTRNIIRHQTGGAIDDCSGIRLENLRIMSMNCFGILAQNSSNIEYENLDCTPKEGRAIVSDADFFHFSGCSGKVTVRNCKAKGAHDDVINIHGTHLKIAEINRQESTVVARYTHKESRGFNPYVEGDHIEYVSGNTLLPYGEAEVTGVEQLSDTDFRIHVTALPDITPGENDVIENVTRTAEMLVEGNVFERIPSRAILCTTRKNVTIRNNTFIDMGGPALLVADDANFWFESGRSGTIVFENNKVINCGAREYDRGCDVIRYEPVIMDKSSKTPVHEKLIVRNNEFINKNFGEYTINLYYLASAEISGNRCNVKLNIKNDGICSVSEC